MNPIAFLLTLIFLGLVAVIYLFGLLVVDHVNFSAWLDRKVQQLYAWLFPPEKAEPHQAAQFPSQKQGLEPLQALVRMEA